MAVIKGTNKFGQTINGTVGDDHIVALGGNDIIYGGAGNDHINAGAGNDKVTGGIGDDLLHGNGGADVFCYSFTVVAGSGGGGATFGGFNAGSDNVLEQNEFSNQYSAWLATLGTDLNADNVIDVDHNGGSQTEAPEVEGFTGTFSAKTSIEVGTGNHAATRYYSGSTVGSSETVTSTDGHDTIADFHVGLDALSLGGVTSAQFQALFSLTDTTDVNGDLVNDTVITITGDTTFSITLLGVSGYSLADLYGV